jgi:hypothetical protein
VHKISSKLTDANPFSTLLTLLYLTILRIEV